MITRENEMERRLRWQCRRGLLELDLLLLRFVDEQYFTLDADNQQVFQALLKLPDQTLLSWVQGQEIPADEFKNIIINITQ